MLDKTKHIINLKINLQKKCLVKNLKLHWYTFKTCQHFRFSVNFVCELHITKFLKIDLCKAVHVRKHDTSYKFKIKGILAIII